MNIVRKILQMLEQRSESTGKGQPRNLTHLANLRSTIVILALYLLLASCAGSYQGGPANRSNYDPIYGDTARGGAVSKVKDLQKGGRGEELKKAARSDKSIYQKGRKKSHKLCSGRWKEGTEIYVACMNVLMDTYFTIEAVKDMEPLDFTGRTKIGATTCEDNAKRICSIFRNNPPVQKGCLQSMRENVCTTEDMAKYGPIGIQQGGSGSISDSPAARH